MKYPYIDDEFIITETEDGFEVYDREAVVNTANLIVELHNLNEKMKEEYIKHMRDSGEDDDKEKVYLSPVS